MLTDRELIILGIESEMERTALRFEAIKTSSNFKLHTDANWSELVQLKDYYLVLVARHDALIEENHVEVPF
jgi:hypothetical protein